MIEKTLKCTTNEKPVKVKDNCLFLYLGEIIEEAGNGFKIVRNWSETSPNYGLYNYVDEHGNYLCENWFKQAGKFVRSYARVVCKSGHVNLINTKGMMRYSEEDDNIKDIVINNEISPWNDYIVTVHFKNGFFTYYDAYALGEYFKDLEYCMSINNNFDTNDNIKDICSHKLYRLLEQDKMSKYYVICDTYYNKNFMTYDGKLISDKIWFSEITPYKDGYSIVVNTKGHINMIDTYGNFMFYPWLENAELSFTKDKNDILLLDKNTKYSYLITLNEFRIVTRTAEERKKYHPEHDYAMAIYDYKSKCIVFTIVFDKYNCNSNIIYSDSNFILEDTNFVK